MTRAELEAKIAEAPDRKYDLGRGCIATSDKDDATIHIQKWVEGTLRGQCFLIGMKSDWNELYITHSVDFRKQQEVFDFLKDLSIIFDIPFPIQGVQTIEKEKVVANTDAVANRDGKIAAYEKILLNRAITLN